MNGTSADDYMRGTDFVRLNDRGNVFHGLGDLEAATADYQKAIGIVTQLSDTQRREDLVDQLATIKGNLVGVLQMADLPMDFGNADEND